MGVEHSNSDRGGLGERVSALIGRRGFIAAGGSISAALLAGCTAESPSAGGEDDASIDGDETTEPTDDDASTGGNFRLLISDLPADIGDFDRLDVSFGSARIFDGGDEGSPGDDEDTGDGTGDDEESGESDDPTEDEDDSLDDEEDDEGETEDQVGEEKDGDAGQANQADGVERRRGFYVLDLDGATVDLTQVIGDKAMSVFEGDLSEGSYNKIELHVSDIEGIVDGEEAEVQVPSEKLQITHPFEIRAGESVDFVFDINVVRRGQENSYNLTPVISQSGVNGEDVDVEELGEDGDADGGTNGDDDEDEVGESATGDGDQEIDDDEQDSGEDDQGSGDETHDDDTSDDEDDDTSDDEDDDTSDDEDDDT